MTAAGEKLLVCWDRRLMRLAREAATWSKDPDEQVGCVIVSPDRRQQTLGYNGFPRGIEDRPDRLADNATKNKLSLHAEHNAILNCPVDPLGWSLYVTKAPCIDCALVIIQKRIREVVSPPIRTDSRWVANQREAAELMREAGVVVGYLDE